MILKEYPGHENEVAKKAKEFKYPNFYKNPKGIGSSKKTAHRKVVIRGSKGKMYGARAIVQRNIGESVSFKQFLTEADSNNLIPIDIFFGRFQPFHLGHFTIVSKMKNPLIIVIRGGKSEEDTDSNPLNYDQQEQIIRCAMEENPVRVISSTDLKTFDGKPISAGFAPSLIMSLKRMGFQVKHIYCGEDRINDYRRQIAAANAKAGTRAPDMQHDWEHMGIDENDIILADRVASGSQIRDAIRSNNYSEFKRLMPKKLRSEDWFNTIRQWMHI